MSLFNTIPEALMYQLKTSGPDTPSHIFRDRAGGRQVFSLGDLHRLAGRFAAVLRDKGVERGSLVGVSLLNSPERLLCDLAILYAGAVSVNIVSFRTDGSDLVTALRLSRVAVLLLDPDVIKGPWAALQRHVRRSGDGTVQVAAEEDLPHLRRVEFIQRRPCGGQQGGGRYRGGYREGGGTGREGVEGKGGGGRGRGERTAKEEIAEEVEKAGGDRGGGSMGREGSKGRWDGRRGRGGGREEARRQKTEEEPEEADDFLGWLEKRQDWYHDNGLGQSDVCNVFTTSGTTGLPKLVAHTHGHHVHFANAFARRPPPVRVVNCCDRSLGTSSGFVGVDLTLGYTRVLRDDRAGACSGDGEREGFLDDRAAFLCRCVREEGCNQLSVPPSDILDLSHRLAAEGKVQRNDMDTAATNHSGTITTTTNHSGTITTTTSNNANHGDRPLGWPGPIGQVNLMGQPITRSMVRAALTLSSRCLVLYGSTELGGISASIVTDADDYHDYDVGHVLPGLEVRIVKLREEEEGEDEGEPLPVGEVGQVQIKHPVPFAHYLHQPALTAAAFTRDGFYRTGDRGKLRAPSPPPPSDTTPTSPSSPPPPAPTSPSSSPRPSPTLTILGRTDDVIMRGIVLIYPDVLEALLMTCPGVKAAVVVGVADPRLTQDVCACLVTDHTRPVQEEVEHVRAFVEGEMRPPHGGHQADDRSLRPGHYLLFDRLPMLYTGRPDRRRITEMATLRLTTRQEI